MRPKGGEWEQRDVGTSAALADVLEIFEEFARRTPGSMVETKRSSVAWHYRSSDPEYGAFQANELLAVLEDTLKNRPYHVLRGNQVIEVPSCPRRRSVLRGRRPNRRGHDGRRVALLANPRRHLLGGRSQHARRLLGGVERRTAR